MAKEPWTVSIMIKLEYARIFGDAKMLISGRKVCVENKVSGKY